MANNRELLKEALADAKSLREMAIANAKAALEESFTPQIKTMLSEKLEEMEKEDMDEEMSKKYMEDDKMEEVEKEEMKEEKEEMEEDLNLDEILAELEESDDLNEVESVTEVDEAVTEEVTEAEEMETEETEEEGEMDMEEKDEPMELEDMSEEDLKSFIEGVIADMIEAGDLEAGEDMEGDDMEDEEVETEEEEEVNIDELLAEIESVDEEYKYEEDDKESKMEEMSKTYDEDDSKMEEAEITEDELDEILGFGKKGAGGTSFVKDFIKDNSMEIDKIMKMDDKKARLEAAKPLIMKFMKMNRAKMDPSAMRSDVSVLRNAVEVGELGGATKGTVSTMESIQKDLNEALEANKVLTEELNEVNLLNAKLLYTNRIFKSKNLTESQKVKVLSTFDKASTVNEVELVYETLNNTTFKSSKKSIKENLGSASRSVGTTKTTKPIIETNDAYKRMQELAFYSVKH